MPENVHIKISGALKEDIRSKSASSTLKYFSD